MTLRAYYGATSTGFGSVGGGGVPGPGSKRVIFRRITPIITPPVQVPPVTPNPPLPGPGGQYRDVVNASNWTTAVGAAVPGDVIVLTQTIPQPINCRGNKYNIPGVNLTTSPGGGAEGNPITITARPNVWINPNNINNNTAALDISNCNHVNVIGVNIKNSQFGLRHMNVEGTVANPFRVAYCTVEDIGHAGMAFQGWFQLITSSFGTPPGGAGNELGYTKNGLVEDNTVRRTGLSATQFGECFYAGKGSGPSGFNGWYGFAENLMFRYNKAEQFTADGFDIKAGSRKIYLLGNEVRQGAAHFGAPLNLLYSPADTKPSWMDSVDPELYVEHNRIYDLNLSKTQASTSNQLVYIGQSGVRYSNNIHFAYPDGTTPFNAAIVLRYEHPNQSEFGTFDSWIHNNLFWGRGVENRGYGASPTPFTLGAWWSELNNITPVGYGGGQHTAAVNGSDFEGIIEAVGENGTAEWNADGHGSGFDLKLASSLRGAGTAITVADLHLEEDISQRTFPGATPNPGPFQDF